MQMIVLTKIFCSKSEALFRYVRLESMQIVWEGSTYSKLRHCLEMSRQIQSPTALPLAVQNIRRW